MNDFPKWPGQTGDSPPPAGWPGGPPKVPDHEFPEPVRHHFPDGAGTGGGAGGEPSVLGVVLGIAGGAAVVAGAIYALMNFT